MHEASLVAALVESLSRQISRQGSARVLEVHVHSGGGFSETVLRQAFEAACENTPLSGARLEIETRQAVISCGCGNRLEVEPESLMGHFIPCARCGRLCPIADAETLQVRRIVVED